MQKLLNCLVYFVYFIFSLPMFASEKQSGPVVKKPILTIVPYNNQKNSNQKEPHTVGLSKTDGKLQAKFLSASNQTKVGEGKIGQKSLLIIKNTIEGSTPDAQFLLTITNGSGVLSGVVTANQHVRDLLGLLQPPPRGVQGGGVKNSPTKTTRGTNKNGQTKARSKKEIEQDWNNLSRQWETLSPKSKQGEESADTMRFAIVTAVQLGFCVGVIFLVMKYGNLSFTAALTEIFL